MAKVETAFVRIWDRLVGAVAWEPDKGHATFEFDEDFIREGLDLAPFKMPLDQARAGSRIFSFRTLPVDTFYGLPGMLADALPDRFGNAVIDAWLARRGRSADDFTPVERLCNTGKRAMGALEFEPALNPRLDESANVEIDDLVALASEVLRERERIGANIREKPTDTLLDIIRVGTSAGGMRPKAVVALDDSTGDLRTGQVRAPAGYGYWIMKLDGVRDDALGDPKGYGRIEYAYYLMARRAGIEMMESRLLEEGGRAHFMTRRFDRTEAGDRLHLQSLCALEHFDFNTPGVYAYEQAFRTIRSLKLPYEASAQQFRRMVFNVAAKNCDDHTKNIAFLMDPGGNWRLSPAYDVIYAHNPEGRFTRRHQMTINGKTDGIGREDLLAVGVEASIKHGDQIMNEVMTAIGEWPEFAEEAKIPPDQARSIQGNLVRL